jgi:hypothetical protein
VKRISHRSVECRQFPRVQIGYIRSASGDHFADCRFGNTLLCQEPRELMCQAHGSQVFDVPTIRYRMDANSRILGKVPLAHREEDKCANGIPFFGNINTELF